MHKSSYSVLTILFCAYLLCYLDRMAMATAIPFIAIDFDLSPLAMGGVLSAFFIGYAVMQIPGGMLADRFGPSRVMVAAIVAWSGFTALTGVANSLPSLLAIRVLFGLSEGPFPPAASKTVALWFEQREVGTANGIQLAAVNIGAAIAPLIVVPLIVNWGWRSVFYCLMFPGLLLALMVWVFVKSSPTKTVDGRRGPQPGDVKFKVTDALKMPSVIWCSLTLFFANIAAWGLMNWLPTYLLQARGFGVIRTGIFTSLPFLAGAVGFFLGGRISDRYFCDRRQVPITVALILASVLTYAAAMAPSGEWAVAALILVFLCVFIALAGLFTLPLVLVPPAGVGGAFGVVNTVGQLAAFLSPLMIGYVLNVSGSNFTLAFSCLVALFAVGACASLQIRQPAFQRLAAQSVQ